MGCLYSAMSWGFSDDLAVLFCGSIVSLHFLFIRSFLLFVFLWPVSAEN